MLCAGVRRAALKVSKSRRKEGGRGALLGREGCRVRQAEQSSNGSDSRGGEEAVEERDRAEGARRRWSKQVECEEKGRGGRVEKMQKELERRTAGAEAEEEEEEE